MAWAEGCGSGERRSDGSASFVVNRTRNLICSQVTGLKANYYQASRGDKGDLSLSLDIPGEESS